MSSLTGSGYKCKAYVSFSYKVFFQLRGSNLNLLCSLVRILLHGMHFPDVHIVLFNLLIDRNEVVCIS